MSHLGVRIDAIIGDLVMKDIVLTRRKHSGRLTAPKKVSLSFLAVIIIGAIVLSLPFSNKKEAASFLDNLFVATSAVCVTGLSPLTVVDQYNLFGQTVLIILVQIGGLGFLTFLYLFLFLARQRITLSRKLVFTEALNQNSLSMLPRLLKTIFIYTVSIETIGLIFFSMFFIPRLGALKGLYYGIWHSISAFCNAGFDLCGSTSLIAYNTNPIINFIVPFEIIMGGLGFIVVLDIHDKYIVPPKTTDFALMFLPTEGLYAEVVQNVALFEELRDKYKITPVGATTLSAFLASLQMGFKTLAIEQRSQEVWDTLRAVKSEFQKFGDMLDKAQKQLQTADKTLTEIVGRRTKAINRTLRGVEELTETDSPMFSKLEDTVDE